MPFKIDTFLPFKIDTFHPDRIVMGVTRGDLTVPNLQQFYDHLIETRTLHHRKILDIAGATSTMRKKDLAEFAASLKGKLSVNARPSGAIAVVADHTRNDLALLFAQPTGGRFFLYGIGASIVDLPQDSCCLGQRIAYFHALAAREMPAQHVEDGDGRGPRVDRAEILETLRHVREEAVLIPKLR